jgi:ribosomal protein L32
MLPLTRRLTATFVGLQHQWTIPAAAPAASLQLAGCPAPLEVPAWQEYIWFAVPKQKVSRSKKRMKTTRQKRIKLKQNIITDPRTGETTLMHKLPFNWKDYIPKFD